MTKSLEYSPYLQPLESPKPELLIIDDEEGMVRVISRLCADTFSRIIRAYNYEQALDGFEELGPNGLVISDFDLKSARSNQNGLELAETSYLQRKQRKQAFILQSGQFVDDFPNPIKSAIDRGVIDAFIAKPFYGPDFKKIIHRTMRKVLSQSGEWTT